MAENLQDHLKIHNSYKTTIKTLNDQLNSPFSRLALGLRFLLTRRGPLTMGAAPLFCFARTSKATRRPDVQFHVLPWSSSAPATGVMHPFSGFTASVCPLQPQSRGEIRLKSADPGVAPAIHANYLATESDRQTAIDALKISREICSRPPLRDVIIEEYAPGAGIVSDQDLLEYVQSSATTIFHPVGSCRMGADAHSVVDVELRVRGLDGIRIADASIMPGIPSGNTNAPVVAIAEKASDLIVSAANA